MVDKKKLDNVKRAEMLFRMHLKPKKQAFDWDYYLSEEFKQRVFFAPKEMGVLERISAHYPNYEFLVWFDNGDLIVFETESHCMTPVERITNQDERQKLLDNARNVDDRWTLWEPVDDLRIEGASYIWRRAL